MLDTQTIADPTDIPSPDTKRAIVDLVRRLKPHIPASIISFTIDELVAKRGIRGVVGLMAAAVNPSTEYLGVLCFDGPVWDHISEVDEFLTAEAQPEVSSGGDRG